MAVEWQEQEVVVNGTRLHVARSVADGGGVARGKPPVVLVHGFSDSGHCWPRLSRELADDYDVVLPDARGHGASARVAPGDVVDMPADLAGVIAALELDRPVLVGHSMGAATVAQVGARFPELVRALVLEDPPWRQESAVPPLSRLTPKDVDQAPADRGPEDRGAAAGAATKPAIPAQPAGNPLQRWIMALEAMTVDEVVAQNRAEHPTWPDEVLRRWSEAKLQLDRNFFLREDAGHRPWDEVVDAIRCPTLLITSSPDRGGIVTPELAREVTLRNPHFTLLHIHGVGHHIRFEAYDRYADAVQAFLSKVM